MERMNRSWSWVLQYLRIFAFSLHALLPSSLLIYWSSATAFFSILVDFWSGERRGQDIFLRQYFKFWCELYILIFYESIVRASHYLIDFHQGKTVGNLQFWQDRGEDRAPRLFMDLLLDAWFTCPQFNITMKMSRHVLDLGWDLIPHHTLQIGMRDFGKIRYKLLNWIYLFFLFIFFCYKEQ